MDEYFHVVKQLPEPLSTLLLTLDPQIAPFVQEIRFRSRQPVLFTMKGKLCVAAKFFPTTRMMDKIEPENLRSCFLTLCKHSVYAHEEELRHGYFTISGGNRIGVAGRFGGNGFSSITSLNIRIARWIICDLPSTVTQPLTTAQEGILIAGPPGSGKTTVLRSMIAYLSRSDRVFAVVDERGELLPTENECSPKFPVSCDAYLHCPKRQAIEMALRCMSPAVIVCDEIGTTADEKALEQGIASGVAFVASIHCTETEKTQNRPLLSRMLQTGAFSTVVYLKGRAHPGQVQRVEHIS